MAEGILHLKDDDFDKAIIQAGGVALVDFWATWCMPCKIIAPIVEAVSKEYGGKIKVAKVEVDEAGEVSSRFNVMNIPTLIFFKDGKETERLIGVTTKEEIARRLDNLLK